MCLMSGYWVLMSLVWVAGVNVFDVWVVGVNVFGLGSWD